MHIVVLVKQVLDPEGVNSYALWGRLEVDQGGRSFTITDNIPRIINAYDEQAMEAALRIRDAGQDVTITVLTVGGETQGEVLKRCLAMGANTAALVRDDGNGGEDGFRTAGLIAAAVRELGPVDLVLCGRQGSDYDQGVVPGVLSELLDWPLMTLGAAVRSDGKSVEVTRMTALGPEDVEADLPAVVSISNEIGTPRPPTSRGMLDARRKRPTILEASALLAAETGAGVELVRISVPAVQGRCEFIAGDSAADRVARLLQKLTEKGVLHV